MIEVATGESRIEYEEDEYTELYREVALRFELLQEAGLSISNPNQFKSLRDWYGYWSSQLPKYASRRKYIYDLYVSIVDQINSALYRQGRKTSPEEFIHEIEPIQLREFLKKIQQLQSIMIEVATGKSRIQEQEEEYTKLYQEVERQIINFHEMGLPIVHPNHFKSLWHWHSYWSSELDNTYAARRKYIGDLFVSVVEPIEKSLYKQRVQATSSEEFIQDLKRRLNPQASAQTIASISIQPTQHINVANECRTEADSLDSFSQNLEEYPSQPTSTQTPASIARLSTQTVEDFSYFADSNSSWTDENVMNPELFLEQRDVVSLTLALNQFAIKVNEASDRQEVLESAGIDIAFLSNLKLSATSNKFATALVAEFQRYRISNQRLDYHPMVSLLKYLCDLAPIYGLADQDVALFNRLSEQGQENLKALAARSTVGRIESPKGQGIGTGVLIGKSLLLTCNHIFSKSQAKQAWVRFNYTSGSYALDSDVFELDLDTDTAIRFSQLDYALVKVKGEPKQRTANLIDAILDSNQEIRLIHHPQGQYVVISRLGQIVQVGDEYIDHNLSTDEGSSGAPIFNRDWQLVAIHRGNLGIGRVGRSLEPGTTSGVPLRAFWERIQTQLS